MGKHCFEAKGTEFCVDDRYEYIHTVGSGTYGVVVAAYDKSTGKKVAIKKILQPFEEECATRNVLREIRFMHYLKHENVLSLLDIDEPLEDLTSLYSDFLSPRDLQERASYASSLLGSNGKSNSVNLNAENPQLRKQKDTESTVTSGSGGAKSPQKQASYKNSALEEELNNSKKDHHDASHAIYVITELMDTTLRRVVRSEEVLSDAHVMFFMYQLLRGLKYLHSAHVIHRDIKPGNILVNRNCDLKICDFGLARYVSPHEASRERHFLTEYVVSRWYRAPEVLLGCTYYDERIDLWSAGCILAELLIRKPLFPGTSTPDQLRRIIATLGTQSEESLSFVDRRSGLSFLKELPTCKAVPISSIVPEDTNILAIDLLEKLLKFDPRQRLTAEQALDHPYMRTFHMHYLEPTINERDEKDLAIDDESLDGTELRNLIWQEITCFHPSASFRIPYLSDTVQRIGLSDSNTDSTDRYSLESSPYSQAVHD
mmetsp:Transcript_14874/g.25798  ORF Transcript_14874/g.25798 Transcript_14874/m.25798 type:complete len:486 (+) Transcript_14874:1089-2546(+)